MSEALPQEHFDPAGMMCSPSAVRERAHRLLQLGLAGRLRHFSVDETRLDGAAEYVAAVTRAHYPDLDIPAHGRWRQFETGGFDRWAPLRLPLQDADPEEAARAGIDLAVISVLLDTDPGGKWLYHEDSTGVALGRSEGLAVATLYMFREGLFSSDSARPMRVDAEGLATLSEHKLALGFQADADNPMLGLEGRLVLVRRLAAALGRHPGVFGQEPPRPGNMFDRLARGRGEVRARDILSTLLHGFSTIWPGRIILRGQNLGDVWMHSQLTYTDSTDQLMPLHKHAQWLTYSLLEPFEWGGIAMTGLDELAGLAEYRSGGLFVDTGVISLRDPHQAQTPHKPSDELVVEWRALTVALLDRLRPLVAEKLGLAPQDFSLGQLMEGGTRAAGRRIAAERRPAGEAPIRIIGDGTVF